MHGSGIISGLHARRRQIISRIVGQLGKSGLGRLQMPDGVRHTASVRKPTTPRVRCARAPLTSLCAVAKFSRALAPGGRGRFAISAGERLRALGEGRGAGREREQPQTNAVPYTSGPGYFSPNQAGLSFAKRAHQFAMKVIDHGGRSLYKCSRKASRPPSMASCKAEYRSSCARPALTASCRYSRISATCTRAKRCARRCRLRSAGLSASQSVAVLAGAVSMLATDSCEPDPRPAAGSADALALAAGLQGSRRRLRQQLQRRAIDRARGIQHADRVFVPSSTETGSALSPGSMCRKQSTTAGDISAADANATTGSRDSMTPANAAASAAAKRSS